MNKINVIYKDRKTIENECFDWANDIGTNYKPDIVVFIAKSGFLFARPIATFFGCPIVDITISRPGNNKKNILKKILPWLPRFVIGNMLKMKINYLYNDRNNEREAVVGRKFLDINWEKYKNVLLVDDSADTGWSLLKAKEIVEKNAGNVNVKTMCYCVMDFCSEKIHVDYYKYRNTIVLTATSRYSKEYPKYVEELSEWQNRS